MTNSIDSDQLDAEEANWPESALFAKRCVCLRGGGDIWDQQDQS